MTRFARLLPTTLLAVAGACAVQAQGIYRSIGPDGKVTYSDVPPASATQVDVLRAPKPAAGPVPSSVPAGAPVPGSQAASTAPSDRARPKSATAAVPAGQAREKAVAPADPAREKAVIGVLGIEDLVRQTVDVCTRTLPTSFRKYADAGDAWTLRNGPLVAQAHRVLAAEFGAAERRVIELGILERNRGVMRPVADAGTPQRIRWCDRSTASISDGSMDVRSNPRLADPLLAARER